LCPLRGIMPKVHHIKSWPQYFAPIREGRRTHELRRNDRDFQVGDTMLLEEFDPQTQKYTGETCEVEITSMTSNIQPCAVSSEALDPAFCILSIRHVVKH
jgi:Domain of unknown function (DUF3850)